MKKSLKLTAVIVALLCAATVFAACSDMVRTPSENAEAASAAAIATLLRGDSYKEGGADYASTLYDNYVEILAKSIDGVPSDIKDAYIARCSSITAEYADKTTNIVSHKAEGAYSATYYNTHMALALKAIGHGTVVDGVDLLAPYYGYATAIGGEYASIYTIYAVKCALNGTEIPAEYATADGVKHTSDNTPDKMLEKAMELKLSGGGWGYAAEEGAIDVDTSGMVIYAFAEYYGVNEAFTAEADVVFGKIRELVNERGAIENWGADNIDTTAVAVTALASAGKHIGGYTALGGKSMMDFILSMKIAEGGEAGLFAYDKEDMTYNAYATCDAMRALISYNRAMRGEPTFYAA